MGPAGAPVHPFTRHRTPGTVQQDGPHHHEPDVLEARQLRRVAGSDAAGPRPLGVRRDPLPPGNPARRARRRRASDPALRRPRRPVMEHLGQLRNRSLPHHGHLGPELRGPGDRRHLRPHRGAPDGRRHRHLGAHRPRPRRSGRHPRGGLPRGVRAAAAGPRAHIRRRVDRGDPERRHRDLGPLRLRPVQPRHAAVVPGVHALGISFPSSARTPRARPRSPSSRQGWSSP